MMKSSKTFADHGPWIHQIENETEKIFISKFFWLGFYFYFYFIYLYLELFLVFLELLWSVFMTYIFRIIFIVLRFSVKPN